MAEGKELAVLVEGDLIVLRKSVFNMLNLQGLFQVPANFNRRLSIFFDPFEGLAKLDEPLHFSFDCQEIVVT